jgi:hypothetical protein
MSALEDVAALLRERGLPVAPAVDDEALADCDARLRRIEAADGVTLPDAVRGLYRTFGPGTRHAMSPVIHRGVVNAWPIWTLAESIARLERSDEPLWQLTPAIDVWLDTGEVTLLREDDTEQSFPSFDDYWASRLAELEASILDPMTGLWLPPSLRPRPVEGDQTLAELLTDELLAGREVVLPGLGIARPTAPPSSASAFDHNPPSPGPSMEVLWLDRLTPIDLDDLGDLPARWGREPEWVREQLSALHHAVDAGLDHGPVDLLGLFLLIGKHHAARMLPSPDEPVEAPAYRSVTARASRAFVERLARGRA